MLSLAVVLNVHSVSRGSAISLLAIIHLQRVELILSNNSYSIYISGQRKTPFFIAIGLAHGK